MNTLLNQQLDELLSKSTFGKLKCESALRVSAATLYRAAADEITATTVVCDLEAADSDSFELLVQEIADEYGLEATIRQRQPGSASVRFTRVEAARRA